MSILNLLSQATTPPVQYTVYAEVSTFNPPHSFADPLHVTKPDWDPQYYWTVGTWPALHGSTLPAAGDPCLLVQDSRGNWRCTWWDAAHTYPPGYEWSYTPATNGPINITDTAESTGTALIQASAFTPDGSAVWVEFFAEEIVVPQYIGTDDFVVVSLFEGTTQITRLAVIESEGTVANGPQGASILARYRFTPTASSHTYKIAAYAGPSAGTPHIRCGSGGTTGDAPAYLRFTKA